MMYSSLAPLILAILLVLIAAGVFFTCRHQGKDGKASVMATLGWGVAFALYFIADYLTMAVGFN